MDQPWSAAGGFGVGSRRRGRVAGEYGRRGGCAAGEYTASPPPRPSEYNAFFFFFFTHCFWLFWFVDATGGSARGRSSGCVEARVVAAAGPVSIADTKAEAGYRVAIIVEFPVVRVEAWYYPVSVINPEYRIAIIKASSSSCCCLGSGPRPCGTRPRPPPSYALRFFFYQGHGRGHGPGGLHTSPVSPPRGSGGGGDIVVGGASAPAFSCVGFGRCPSCSCATRCCAGASGGDGVGVGAGVGACAIPGAGAGVRAGASADSCLGTS